MGPAPAKEELEKYNEEHYSPSPTSTNKVGYNTHYNNFNQVNSNFFSDKRTQGA